MTWLAGQLQTDVAVSVTYRRGAQSVTFDATLGSSLLKTTDTAGRVKLERTDRDFIFTATLLDFGSGPVLPQRGDAVESNGEVFEVMAPGREPHYRYSDPFKTILRVHSKYSGAL
jgi:hypothetical protein